MGNRDVNAEFRIELHPATEQHIAQRYCLHVHYGAQDINKTSPWFPLTSHDLSDLHNRRIPLAAQSWLLATFDDDIAERVLRRLGEVSPRP